MVIAVGVDSVRELVFDFPFNTRRSTPPSVLERFPAHSQGPRQEEAGSGRVSEIALGCNLTVSHDREKELFEFVRGDEFREARVGHSDLDEEHGRVEHEEEIDLFDKHGSASSECQKTRRSQTYIGTVAKDAQFSVGMTE